MMRVYQLFPDGPWIDLDAVQMIYPPVADFDGVVLRWRLAFQDNTTVHAWAHPTEMINRAYDEIYIPFLNAWKNK